MSACDFCYLTAMSASLTPQAFIAKWQASKLKESAAYQEHFLDLCEMLDQPTPAEIDKDGSVYTFQKSVVKAGTQVAQTEQTLYGPETIVTKGRKGFADVWYRGHFAWEYKGKHKDLGKAYDQLLQYHEALESPQLLVVCDFENYEIHTKFENCVSVVHRFTNAELHKPEVLKLLTNLFEYPNGLRPAKTAEAVTEEAAEHFAKLALGLRRRREDPHRAAHFLMKVLFCLFAEDVDLLPDKLFQKIVKAALDGGEFVKEVRALFRAMRRGGRAYLKNIDHFNGGLFEDDEAFELEGLELQILHECSKLDWSQIEPAIFGTLFERSLDPDKRSMAGAHYTSKGDITTLVEPVLMLPLRREWTKVRAKAEKSRAKRDGLKGKDYYRQNQALLRLLEDFSHRLSTVRVLDPACGSGNFLYVALNLLKDLEKEVITYAATCGHNLFRYVGPEQLYGIEKDSYAVELARLVVWIGHIQWDKANGLYRPEAPILKPLDNIKEMDAILDLADAKHPKEPKWPECDVIVGNPPFLGGKRLRAELGSGYLDCLFALFQNRVPHEADLCCYWFEKARAHIKAGLCGRAGLLATQGIRGGSNRTVLKRIKESGDIFFAISDRDWILDGANVHISMVAFDAGTEKVRQLDGKATDQISPNLMSGSADITKAVCLGTNKDFCFQGPVIVGPFDIELEEARKMLHTPNPKPICNSDVIRPLCNASDITQQDRGLFVIDFGKKDLSNSSIFEAPFEFVKRVVKPIRDKNRDRQRRDRWWMHGRSGEEIRKATKSCSRVIVTPRVSKHRIFIWQSPIIIPSDATVVFAHSDDYFFGVLHARLHEVWARAQGTQVRERESGFRYTPTTCFETFPFPEDGSPKETKQYSALTPP
ncbi:MAG: class I SAM-dependent DNA methyltransferase [Planctomycetes bacterium]|nr:class I SAM-dependent DNA methyltransferase [Planctomycetota bacterium]